jgi:hypothetical protein
MWRARTRPVHVGAPVNRAGGACPHANGLRSARVAFNPPVRIGCMHAKAAGKESMSKQRRRAL